MGWLRFNRVHQRPCAWRCETVSHAHICLESVVYRGMFLAPRPTSTTDRPIRRTTSKTAAPFDDQRLAFAGEGAVAFFPINISALSPTLVESELFGHRRGAFTGAVADRTGWLETCPELGSVFLDELGD